MLLDLQLSKYISGEISSLGRSGASSPAQPVCERQPYQRTHETAGSRESFQIWNRPRVLCKKHSQRFKALMSRKRQTINQSPTWWQMEKEIQVVRSNHSINYGPICACRGLLKCWLKTNPAGPHFCCFVWESETTMEDLCHRRASSISHAVTLTVSGLQEDLRPEVLGWPRSKSLNLHMIELCCDPLQPLPRGQESHPNTWSLTSYVIHTLCHHCVWLSWTCSHTGSTFSPLSHTHLAPAHTCSGMTASHSQPCVSSLSFTLDLWPACVFAWKTFWHFKQLWACKMPWLLFSFTLHIIVFPRVRTHAAPPTRTTSKHLSGQLVFGTNRIYLMPKAWHWGNIGGADERGCRNWLLGFKSISLAKHKPEEMGSLLCAFTVVCCC